MGKRRQGRGSQSARSVDDSSSALLPRNELLVSAESSSTLKNVRRAGKVLSEFFLKNDAPDPKEVSKESSVLILNLLASYCRMGTKDALGDNSMGAIVQGLRHVYEKIDTTKAGLLMMKQERRREIR